jgi:O-antigen ligase
MILGALFPALFSLFEYFSGSGWCDKTIMQYRINGTFLHPATLAFYLLFVSPLLYGVIHEKQKRPIKLFLVFLLILNLLLVALTLTRGAWIGMLVVFLAYGIIKNRKFLAFILIFLFMSYLFIPAINERVNDVFNPKYNSSFTTRLRIVTTTLPAISVSPFFGNGIGSFGQVHLDYNEEAKTYDSLQAHNDYLRLGIEVGLVGLLFYLLTFLFLFTLLIKLYLKNDKAYKYYILSLLVAWLGALAISSGDNLLRTMPVQFLLWSYTGAVLAYAHEHENIRA